MSVLYVMVAVYTLVPTQKAVISAPVNQDLNCIRTSVTV